MRSFITLALGVALIMSVAPRAEEIDLAGQWRFARDMEDVGLDDGWQDSDFDDSGWEMKEVPGDWGDFDGVGWYRHEIDLPADLNGRHMFLVFDGVDDQSRVYINGELRASCDTWNRRHWANLTDLAGETVTVAVRVNDLGQGGGIHAPVRLVLSADRSELLEGPWHREPVIESPDWIAGSVIYEVFVRDFSDAGDFAGLTERIPELAEMGVDVIWLMPIHPIGELHRKGTVGSPYAARDHMAIDPNLGTEEDLHALVDAVHANGMHIIIDMVLNHCSPDNPLTETHPDWFQQDADGNPVADNPDWWDIVDFDWENREVWDYFFGVLDHWVRDFDIDGYRCDVASLMPTEFWEEARQRLETIKPDVMMLAESDAPELHRAAFDVSYNWTLWDNMGPVLRGERDATALTDAMEQDFYTFQCGAMRMAFAENHDKERGPVEFGGIRQARAASLIALTVCSTPLLYNGQEVGYSELRDIFEQIPIDWSDPHHIRPWFEDALALRRESEALRLGDYAPLAVDQTEAVFAFTRTHDDETAVVVINIGERPLDVTGEALAAALTGAETAGALESGLYRPESGMVSLPPYAGDVWFISTP